MNAFRSTTWAFASVTPGKHLSHQLLFTRFLAPPWSSSHKCKLERKVSDNRQPIFTIYVKPYTLTCSSSKWYSLYCHLWCISSAIRLLLLHLSNVLWQKMFFDFSAKMDSVKKTNRVSVPPPTNFLAERNIYQPNGQVSSDYCFDISNRYSS